MARLLTVLGLLPVVLAVAVWLGLGITRQLLPLHVTLAALCFGLLPVAGLWSLLGRGAWAAVVAVWSWPVIMLMLLPGFFPGEFRESMVTGVATLAAIGGPEWVKMAGQLGEEVPMVEGLTGTPPAPAAPRSEVQCAKASPLGPDEVALPYEGQGHSLVIPVVFGETEVPMLFDTGATVTTLSEEALARLGVRVPSDAPELKLRTANGERTARLVQVPEVWIGGMRVSPVTVGVCEECADGRVSGLLGLNVSGLFLVTVDSARKEVLFRARAEAPDRVVDIAPWLGLDALATVFPDGRIEVEVTANNRSQHAVSMADVGIHCGEDSFVGSFSDIPALGSSMTRVRLPRRTDCEGYSVSLDHARW